MEGEGSEEVGEGMSSTYQEVGAGASPTEASVTLAMTTIMMEGLGHLIKYYGNEKEKYYTHICIDKHTCVEMYTHV